MAVFSTNQITTEINVADHGQAEDWKRLIDFTGITNTLESTIDERDVIDSIFTKRVFTGGMRRDISFEGFINRGDDAHDFLWDLANKDSVKEFNDRKIRFKFPIQKDGNNNPEIHTYTGVIKMTSDFGGQATELSKLTFDFLVNGKAVATAESNKK